MATDLGREIFEGIVRGQRIAAEAERSFNEAVEAKRRGDCWGCGHKSHEAGDCSTPPRFAWEERCACTVHEGQL